MEAKALTVRQPLTLSTWQLIEAVAPAMHASRLFGVTSKEAAAAIMLKGFELGFGLGASFEFIQVIEGKPTLSPRGALAKVLDSGLLEDMKIDGNDTACTVWMKRKNGPEYTLSWTLEDARRADLLTDVGSTRGDGTKRGKGGYEKYPANMLKWRAIGYVIDVLFSDVCGGIKRADEFGAEIDAGGDVIDAPYSVGSVASAPAANKTVTLNDLLERTTPEHIMELNEGRIPATNEEVAKVVAALEQEKEG